MTIDQLEAFNALAETLNFTRAAEQLYVTQPTLSRNIAALEEELGFPLVTRSTRSVTLTVAGQSFAGTCRELLENLHRGIDFARSKIGVLSGTLNIGLPQGAYEPEIVDAIRRMKETYPGVHVSAQFMFSADLPKALESGRLDVILASACQGNFKNLQKLIVKHFEASAVLPEHHPLAGRETLSLTELQNERFVMVGRRYSSATWEKFSLLSADCGVTPRIVQEVSTLNAMCACVVCNDCVSVIFTDRNSLPAKARVVLVPLEERADHYRYLFWTQQDNPCLQAFLSCVTPEEN